MPVDDQIRQRVVFLGGKVSGVACPECGARNRDIDLSAHNIRDVACPNCGATVLSEAEMSALRQAGKL